MRRVLPVIIVVIVIAITIYFYVPSATTGTLKVQVTKADGTPISALKVNLWDASKPLSAPSVTSRSTDGNGYAEFNLPPGEYFVGFDREAFPAEYIYPSETLVTVQALGTTDEIIKLYAKAQPEKKVKLTIIVVGPEGRPKADLQVGLWTLAGPPDEPDLGYKVTDSLGAVVFEVPPGDYIIGFNPSTFPSDIIRPERMVVTVGEEGAEKVIRLFFMP